MERELRSCQILFQIYWEQQSFWQVFPALSCLAKLHLDFAGLIYLFTMLREVELFVAVENLAYFEDLEHLKDESETD